MAKPLRIGSMIETDKPLSDVVALLQRYREAGLDHAFASQIFGPDALTLLAVAGSQVPGIGLGTGVVPVYPRHPMMLAQQALTVQMATDNRLLLGIGLSHQVVVEGMWGMSYERPAAYMREYLTSLMPLLAGRDRALRGGACDDQRLRPTRHRRRRGAARARRRPGRHHAQADGPRRRRHHHLDDRHGDHRRSHCADHHGGGRGGGPAGATRRGLAADQRHQRPEAATGAHQRGLLHLPEPALLQGHARQGRSRGRRRHRVHRGRGSRGRVHRQAGRCRCHGLRGRHHRRCGGAGPGVRSAQRDRSA